MMVTTGARILPRTHCHDPHYRFFQFVFFTQNHFVTHFFSNKLCCFLVDHLVVVAIAPIFIITLMTSVAFTDIFAPVQKQIVSPTQRLVYSSWFIKAMLRIDELGLAILPVYDRFCHHAAVSRSCYRHSEDIFFFFCRSDATSTFFVHAHLRLHVHSIDVVTP